MSENNVEPWQNVKQHRLSFFSQLPAPVTTAQRTEEDTYCSIQLLLNWLSAQIEAWRSQPIAATSTESPSAAPQFLVAWFRAMVDRFFSSTELPVSSLHSRMNTVEKKINDLETNFTTVADTIQKEIEELQKNLAPMQRVPFG